MRRGETRAFGLMIQKQSPEGQLLTVCWRAILSMAGPVSEQYKWLLTGIAAILGLVVANLESIQKVVHDAHLKSALCLLIASVLLASIAYLLSTMLKARNEVMSTLEQTLGTAQAQAVLSQMKTDQSLLHEELCRPFFGPLKFLMKKAAEKGANDPFAAEKGGIALVVWQAYAMWLSIPLAAVALVVLVLGLR
jgi:hypothetical protein